MRAIVAFLFVLTMAGAAVGQEKKGESVPPPAGKIKTDFSYFEYWSLNLKSFSLEVVDQRLPDGRVIPMARMTYVLEFDCDIPYFQLEPLQRNLKVENKKLRHNFYDAQNVAVNGEQFYAYKIQGEISGVRGEAFRVTLEFFDAPRFSVMNAKKVVVRVPSWDIGH